MGILEKKTKYPEFLEMEVPEGDASIYELLNGEIVKRASPNTPHQRASLKLIRHLDRYNQEKDLGEQFAVREYWIADPQNRSIEVYSMENNRYRLFSFAEEEGKIQSSLLPDFELEVSEVF
jgi:Uma2 family endonuclease